MPARGCFDNETNGVAVDDEGIKLIRLRRKGRPCAILGPCVRETRDYYVQGGPTEHRRHKDKHHITPCEHCPPSANQANATTPSSIDTPERDFVDLPHRKIASRLLEN